MALHKSLDPPLQGAASSDPAAHAVLEVSAEQALARWKVCIDAAQLVRLAASEAVDPLSLPWCLDSEVVASENDDLVVWEALVPAGEQYIPPMSRHLVLMCLSDAPFALWSQGLTVRAGPLRAGDVMLRLARDKPVYGFCGQAVRMLHISFGARPHDLVAPTLPQKTMDLRDPALSLLLQSLRLKLASRQTTPLFVSSVAHALRRYLVQQTQYKSRGLTDDEWARLMSYLRKHMDRSLSVAELAHHLGLSERSLSRRFRHHTGESLMTYVLHFRLAHAYELIALRGHGVTEAAEATGFVDAAHFSRRFRQRYGISPSTLRSR